MMYLPIFPLSVFLLPGGCIKLRIFEPRYLRMITLALKEQGFVIWFLPEQFSSQNLTNIDSDKRWGSWVEIINFHQGVDGILEIDARCLSLIRMITTPNKEQDLFFANVIKMKHWSEQSYESLQLSENTSHQSKNLLADSLARALKSDDAVKGLYQERFFENTHWVIARWLELLPIDASIKHAFANENNFLKAKGFVESIFGK